MENAIKKILNIYLGILVIVPIVYAYEFIQASTVMRHARERGEEMMGDCSGITMLLIPFFLIMSILTIIGITFLKKSNNRTTLIIATSLIGLFPISIYVSMFYIMIRYW
ncbi:MAG: hypothetical protein ACT4ON_14915 [Bacteroidota bacterium]